MFRQPMSTSEGIELAKKGGYAFFMESPGIQYLLQHSCDLVQVGGLLSTQHYALALKQGTDSSGAVQGHLNL